MPVPRGLALSLLVALASCGGGEGQPVTLLDYQAMAPTSFQPRAAANPMRLAEFVAAESGEPPAEVIVYYFGEGQGGSAEANIARWSAQFSGPDGGEVAPRVTVLQGTGFPTTLAEYEGAYARGVGMGPGRQEATPDQALAAAVVETPRGNLFLQLVGDREAVAAAREDFVAMVRSIGPASPET